MAFSAVQTVTQVTATAQQNPTLSISPTAGNLIVAHIGCAPTDTLSSVTDNQGGTWVVSSAVDVLGTRGYQAYCLSALSGVTTLTFNFSASATSRLGADEYAGGPFAFDTQTSGAQSGIGGATVGLSPDLAPSAAGELIVCSVAANPAQTKTWTAPSGYTLYSGSDPTRLRSAYQLSGTTSEACDWTYDTSINDQAVQVATAFKLATSQKTINGLARASVKTINSLALASVKTVQGLA